LFPGLLYGAQHPYGRPLSGSGTGASVEQLTRGDLVDYYSAWRKPADGKLIVVGDASIDEVADSVESRFSTWAKGAAAARAIEPANPVPARVVLVDRPGAVQSYIYAGHIAPPRTMPNTIAIDAMNRILGGAFTSRINMNLREDKHWTYGARSSLFDGAAQRMFLITAPVQFDKTAEAMSEIDREIRELLERNPIASEELDATKQNLVLRLPGAWETSRAVIRSTRETVLYGLADDYHERYADRVRALTVEAVQQAAEDVLRPHQMVWLVVGDVEKIGAAVRDLNLGSVQHMRSDGTLFG
jgi:zinc protease